MKAELSRIKRERGESYFRVAINGERAGFVTVEFYMNDEGLLDEPIYRAPMGVSDETAQKMFEAVKAAGIENRSKYTANMENLKLA